MSYNQNSGYGQAFLNAVAQQVPALGRVFIVVNSSDTDEENYQRLQEVFIPDTAGQVRFFTSLSDAYDATESNNNDVIVLDGNSTHSLSSMLTVSKNRVHFIGMDGGERLTAQGAKIQLDATGIAGDNAATITVTGVRCSFRNIKVMNGGTHANSVAAFIDEGEGTLLKNCSFMKSSDLDVATVANFICRSDSATYRECEFGFDTLQLTADRPNFWIKASGATRCKHLRVVDCIFSKNGSAAANDGWQVEVENTSSLAFENLFKNCVFTNALVASASSVAANGAISSVASLAEGNILFVNCATNADDMCDASGNGDTTNIKVANGAATSNVDGGLALTPAST